MVRGRPRALRALALLVVVVMMAAGCVRTQQVRRRQLTGTCTGACNHYVSCKSSDDLGLYQACMQECREVFSDPISLQAFESLYCADAIAFVEGRSGREPGQPADQGLATGEASDGQDQAAR